MGIRVALHHQTRYTYDRLISLGPQLIRLRPAPHCRTLVTGYSLNVRPKDHFVNWQQDPYGNYLARFVFQKQAEQLCVDVDLVADLTVINPFDFFVDASADTFPFTYEDWLARELRPFLETLEAGPLLAEFLSTIDRRPENTVDFLVALNRRLEQDIRYLVRMEPGVQTPEATLANRSGSCRDSGWLLVQVLRHLGLAARFVSGYLIQLKPDTQPLDGPAGAGEDFTDLHAWAEVYLPGAGWVGLDPTSGLLAGEGHIPLACTPDPSSAAPITGSHDPCDVEFSFSMKLTRIEDRPRVTRPYTDAQWSAIDQLGRDIDQKLKHGDVRLTMGGEPTFISVDDMDSAEWNTAAVGPDKRRLSGVLIQRLQKRFAPGGLLHYGSGKWYPGESLPRWALTCFWRTDGVPIWNNPSLTADEERDYGFGQDEARRFVAHLTNVLGVRPDWIVPAFEDIYYYLWKEQRLPVNVDPRDSKLEDPEERARLARLVEQGASQATGFVLPLRRQWWQGRGQWTSGPWPVRTECMFLLPGDSPLGLRLPLGALPWVPESARPGVFPRDPFEERPALPESPFYRRQTVLTGRPEARSLQGISEQPRPVSSAGEPARSAEAEEAVPPNVVRTALCVEQRQGRLYVFFPPVEAVEDYLDLVSAVERTAEELQMPVIIEGYLPPHDDRLRQLKVTPDPGVIEVNVHPSASWEELVDNTAALYEEARLSRLGTEKFDLDGQHTGTGGGNHVVLGGPTAADSPFLRRPDLLRSLVGYWVNHPSLSYLFSGRFIGPTSQAPRVDEGRADALYELNLAFSLVPEPGQTCPPWLIDRLFRNLLVDLTGNTHRAEFCIDKLYSPEGSTGRLGLVEFRGFEMPPHARMSLTQQLLIRGLVARFWDAPYREPPVEWGTALHDRFMLPYFVWKDFGDVIDELNRAALAFRREWFTPHFEFRFPLIGDVTLQDVTVELRSAIEPWYVLGEEGGAGGTVRYVDSSMERLQVKVSGLTDDRHVLTCNGRRIPLHPTGVPGESVAGVRYRAWQPPNCLHPTIPIHTPLVFDMLDTWSGRSIGGCTYHVAHPAGRNYESFPVNAYSAEARRAGRFFRMGHTPGSVATPEAESNPAFPLTLDLRRAVPSA